RKTMDTQRFYRRVEIFKCFLFMGILTVLILIFLKLPKIVTVEDIKQRRASISELPLVVIKDGRITIENEQIMIRGNVRIEEQPIDVRVRERSEW
ncbi:hypothetical protein JW964_26100, partial [candidate division KSB1 bacterium]|nr:hypothetical protein [candidate division KSB1 bacterium]